MSLLPIGRSPFPATGTTADGSATAPYITETAGQAGLDAIEAAYTIADGDNVVIDAAGDPVWYRAALVGADIHWYTPILGGTPSATRDGLRDEDPASPGWTVVNAVDYDGITAGRISVRCPSTTGQSAYTGTKVAKGAASLVMLVVNDAKLDPGALGGSSLLCAFGCEYTGGAIGFGVFGDSDNWQVNGDSAIDTGVSATTERAVELYYDVSAGRAYVRFDRSAQLQHIDVGANAGGFSAMCVAICSNPSGTVRVLSFSSFCAGYLT